MDNFSEFMEYINYQSKRYKVIDMHSLRSVARPSGYKLVEKETKLTFWLMMPFLIIITIIVFLSLLPFRLISDFRNILHDFINHMSK